MSSPDINRSFTEADLLRMSPLQRVFSGEGGTISLGRLDEFYCVVSDERSLRDFFPSDELVRIVCFVSEAERQTWMLETYPAIHVLPRRRFSR